jgi:hypothetical protein
MRHGTDCLAFKIGTLDSIVFLKNADLNFTFEVELLKTNCRVFKESKAKAFAPSLTPLSTSDTRLAILGPWTQDFNEGQVFVTEVRSTIF